MSDVTYKTRSSEMKDIYCENKSAGYMFRSGKGWLYVGDGAGPPLNSWALRDIAAELDRRNAVEKPGIPAKIEERPSEQLRLDFSESSDVD